MDDFEDWVKAELRLLFPHAALLATVGKLYGLGSVPTHRWSVDFPLMMVEGLKNKEGALNDPLMYGWLRTGKLRYVELDVATRLGAQHVWRDTLLRYGIHSMMIHGVQDNSRRRFAIFQFCNPHGGASLENVRLISSLIDALADVVWRAIDGRLDGVLKQSVGHPTISLTPTELHIVELLAQGLSNKEIARLRGVSDSTIKTQVQRTGAKVGANRRAEIVAIVLPMLSPLPAQTLIDCDEI